jgi:hypothetical protein
MQDALEIAKALDWSTIIVSILAVASAIVAVTPTEKDDSVVSRLQNLADKFLKK